MKRKAIALVLAASLVSCASSKTPNEVACSALGDVMRDNAEEQIPRPQMIQRIEDVREIARAASPSIRKGAERMAATLKTDDPEQGDLAAMLIACMQAGVPAIPQDELMNLGSGPDCEEEVRQVREAQRSYRKANGVYAVNIDVLVEDGFLTRLRDNDRFSISTDDSGRVYVSRGGKKALGPSGCAR